MDDNDQESPAHAPNVDTIPSRQRLSLSEAARWFGVSRYVVRNWVRNGTLPYVDHVGQWWVDPTDVLATQQRQHAGDIIPRWQADPEPPGQRLRLASEHAGLTQQQLAKATGLTHENVSRLELGDHAPTGATLRRLTAALKVTPAVLIGEEPLPFAALMTPDEAARHLAVSRECVWEWLCLGRLEGQTIAGRWRIPAEAVFKVERRHRLRGTSRRLDPRVRG